MAVVYRKASGYMFYRIRSTEYLGRIGPGVPAQTSTPQKDGCMGPLPAGLTGPRRCGVEWAGGMEFVRLQANRYSVLSTEYTV